MGRGARQEKLRQKENQDLIFGGSLELLGQWPSCSRLEVTVGLRGAVHTACAE